MIYKAFYKGNKVKVLNTNQSYIINSITKDKHIWPEDNTIITFQVNGTIISYSITNPSDRTSALLNQGVLGIGLFVEEDGRKSYVWDNWRSSLSISNHPHRRCSGFWRINTLSGTIDLEGYWPLYSRTLNYIFNCAANYQDPEREDGYTTIALGIGRYMSDGTDFRPHKISTEQTITVPNDC